MGGVPSYQRFVSAFVGPFKDFFFPPICFSCNHRLMDDESRVCAACWQRIERVQQDDHTVNVLRERFKEEGILDGFHSCYYFQEGEVFQKLVHSLKYEAVTSFGTELGRHVGRVILDSGTDDEIDGIVPVPLHRLKQRERGYNQSEFICRGISEIVGSPVLKDLVRRKKNTVSQTHLTAQERTGNVGDAFDISDTMRKFVAGKKFLVVDDVITTGSTIGAVAGVLKEVGAVRVIAASAGLAKLH